MMTTEELLFSEMHVVESYVDQLEHRRASGEYSSLYPELCDVTDTVAYLSNAAPGHLRDDLDELKSRCTSMLRSIAN